MADISVDVLICGGGMSGMACAAFAAQSGAKVLVVEKQSSIGGSSVYSAGMFWGPKTYGSLRSWVPDGDIALQKASMRDYLPAVQWMRENDVPTASRYEPIMTIGIGYPIKIASLHELHLKRISQGRNRSTVLLNTSVVQLIQERPAIPGSRITGAVIKQVSRGDNKPVYSKVTARHVVLATGGFQGSRSLTARYLGPGGDNVFVRSNRGSVGDGLTLATSVGASTSRGMSTYYGHLLAAPLNAADVDPKDFLPLAQYRKQQRSITIAPANSIQQKAGIAYLSMNAVGDLQTKQLVTKLSTSTLQNKKGRRGVLLFNEKTRREHCTTALFPNAGDVDRLQKARSHGCNVATSPTLDGLCNILNTWGVNGSPARRTITLYDRAIRLGDESVALDVPTDKCGAPPAALVEDDGPFFAMEVQPSITFTYGGIAIDSNGHAISADKLPIPGLMVAGVDAGGFNNLGYAGGLALAFVTGYWAAQTVAKDLNLPIPQLPSANRKDTEESRQPGAAVKAVL